MSRDLRAHGRAARAARRRGRGDGAAARRARDLRLLRDRTRRGVGEPRALRRRPLRAARGRGRPHRDVRAHPRGGLRRRGQAPDHARDLRAVGRLLRRLLRPGPARANQDRRRLSQRRSSASTSSSRRPLPRLPSRSANAPRTRWRCTSTTTARCRCRSPGSPRSRSPPGSPSPRGGGPELPVGFQIAGPAFSESAILDAAFALERAIGFDAVPPGVAA